MNHDFVDHYVHVALAERSSKKNDKKQAREQPLLMEFAERTENPFRLRGELLSFLPAGRDTTAELIGWLIFLLARHPRVLKRLRESIVERFSTSWSETEITFAELKQCAYLQACMSETLRICPVVAFQSREAMKDIWLPHGGGTDGMAPVFVKKGTFIQWSQYTMGRESGAWGEDADEFKPERFLGRKNGWEYLPFGGRGEILYWPAGSLDVRWLCNRPHAAALRRYQERGYRFNREDQDCCHKVSPAR